DSFAPTDNTSDLQFTAIADADGDNIAVTWTAFTDTNLSDHRIITYTNSGCSTGAVDHGLTGSSTNSNSTIVDGLSNGIYYATVTAYDLAGNTTVPTCPSDSMIVDTSAPNDNTANLQFTAMADADGDNI